MYADNITVEEVTYSKPLFKKADIVHAIKDDLAEKFNNESELKNEYAVAKFKTSDELHKILEEASQIFTKHAKFFERMIAMNVNENVVKHYSHVGYREEQTINKNVTKFLIDNEGFTYKEIYDFVTKDIKND